MRVRTALLLVLLVALAVFTALNWSAFSAPTELHLLFTRVDAPLGIIMLAVVSGLTLLYGASLAWLETAALFESRRRSREVDAQRQLADNAEASRYAELKGFLVTELGALRAAPETAGRELALRIDRMEAALRGDIERAGNTLAAYIGELEDRLQTDRAGRREAP